MANNNNTVKILFFGDLVGRPGRFAVRDYLSGKLKVESGKFQTAESGKLKVESFSTIDCQPLIFNFQLSTFNFIIANVENASHGFGLTEKNYNDLSEYGIDCMTSGNHIWDKKEIFNYINGAEKLIRPFNYPEDTQGQGSRVFELHDGTKIGVINALGRVFMSPVDSQWTVVAEEIKRLKDITPIVIMDFHAEATAEKVCFAKFCSELCVSAFFGTHTHVQTADEQIINNMAYITDAGFCGAKDGVIGMDYKTSVNRFTTVVPERYDVADGNVVQINAVEVEIDKVSGHAVSIRRIFELADKNKKEEENER
ncbi:YmdB family metallophosphoesterase [bacterium]|nr:YmdB family metallophosphoesterase [bacterium]